MNDLNRCEFIGRLTADPEIRYAASGTAMCTVTLATNWKTKEKEGVEFVRVVAYMKTAEIIGQYLNKGSQVYIAGRMTTRSYDKNGEKRYSTEVVCDQMQMLGSKGQENKPLKAPPLKAQSIAELDNEIPF